MSTFIQNQHNLYLSHATRIFVIHCFKNISVRYNDAGLISIGRSTSVKVRQRLEKLTHKRIPEGSFLVLCLSFQGPRRCKLQANRGNNINHPQRRYICNEKAQSSGGHGLKRCKLQAYKNNK